MGEKGTVALNLGLNYGGWSGMGRGWADRRRSKIGCGIAEWAGVEAGACSNWLAGLQNLQGRHTCGCIPPLLSLPVLQ